MCFQGKSLWKFYSRKMCEAVMMAVLINYESEYEFEIMKAGQSCEFLSGGIIPRNVS